MSTEATAGPVQGQRSKLHIGLWIVQILLAVAFGMAGVMKLSKPIAELAAQMGWVKFYSPEMVRFIGAAELLGAIGLILPAATRILPGVTALAAAGLLVVMILAAVFHVTHDDLQHIPGSLVLGSLAAFVAWGRFKKAPIQAR
jgi:putative oxidoreductase